MQRHRMLFIVALTAALLSALAALGAEESPSLGDQVTTVYIVRHAEKVDLSADPSLSPIGRQRAADLARTLADEGIDAVFVTQFARTRETGQAVADAAGLTPRAYGAADAAGVAATILAEHAGEEILLVGHSNTVDDLAAALGAEGLSDLDESEYDHLFVVHRFPSGAHLDRLRYGEPSALTSEDP